jgi:GH25 family lysozyme M1 (1,4-beta-N-acetylmuramidase)
MTVQGIDVSAFQRGISWAGIAAGDGFAIAKATEGVGYTDPAWPAFSAVLAEPGPLVPGCYHFARPDLGNGPQREADWFCEVVGDFVATCRRQPTGVLLALDLEAEVSAGVNLRPWRDAFCSRVLARLGGTCGWYSFWDYVQEHGLNVATPYWSWLAWPDSNGSRPATAFQVSMQQFGSGPQGGVVCDLDRYLGSSAGLLALANDPIQQGGFTMSYGLKLALVGLMYWAVLGRGPTSQPEADQWASELADDGSNAWAILQTIAGSGEATTGPQAPGTAATGILRTVQAAVAALQVAPVGQHDHGVVLSGSTGGPIAPTKDGA